MTHHRNEKVKMKERTKKTLNNRRMHRRCAKCHNALASGEYEGHNDGPICYRCWLNTVQEHLPGLEMTGSEWKNFRERR